MVPMPYSLSVRSRALSLNDPIWMPTSVQRILLRGQILALKDGIWNTSVTYIIKVTKGNIRPLSPGFRETLVYRCLFAEVYSAGILARCV